MPGHKTYNIGDEVLAADFNPFVMDQVVTVWASAAARAAGWASPPTGAMSFRTDAMAMEYFNGTAWVSIAGAAKTSWSVIADVNLAADGPIAFASIPQTFTHLQIVASLRSAASAVTDTLMLRINADAGANYFYGQVLGSGSTVAHAQGTTTGGAYVGPVSASTGTRLSAHRIDIPNYTQSTFNKVGTSQAGAAEAGNAYEATGTWAWLNNGAINRLDLVAFTAPNTFKAGSRATLLGVSGT